MIPETEQKDDKKKSIFRMKNKNKSDNNIRQIINKIDENQEKNYGGMQCSAWPP